MNIVKRKLIAIAIALALGLAVIAGPAAPASASAASDASCTRWLATVSNGTCFSNQNVYGIYKVTTKGGGGTFTDFAFITGGGIGFEQTTSFFAGSGTGWCGSGNGAVLSNWKVLCEGSSAGFSGFTDVAFNTLPGTGMKVRQYN